MIFKIILIIRKI